MQYLAIFLGGGLGSLCRFYLSRFNGFNGTWMPWGTLTANFMSCIVLGFITAYLMAKTGQNPIFKPLLAVGFCGGFSTFSTFSLETFNLLKQGQMVCAFTNISLSIVLCLLALFIGFSLQAYCFK